MPFKYMIAALSLFCLSCAAEDFNRTCTGYYMYRKGKTGILNIKLSTRLNLKYKKSFWENIKKEHDRGKKDYYIYSLHFPRVKHKLPPWDIAKKSIDNMFASTAGVKTYPGLLFAVVPNEENIVWGGQLELQNKIYDYLTSKYKLTVFQWLTEPYAPRLDIQADGWVVDAYGINGEDFFRHLQKFILYGKPVVPILWASEPGFDKYYSGGMKQIIAKLVPKFRYCRELNLPVILFAVGGPKGSVNTWMHSQKFPFPDLRKFFDEQFTYLTSNDKREKFDHEIPVYECCGDKDNVLKETFNFNNFDFVDNSLVNGVYNMRVDKNGLHFSGGKGKSSSLNWHFKSASKIMVSMLELKFQNKSDSAEVKLEYSTDNKKWSFAADGNTKSLKLPVRSTKKLYVRVTLSGGNVTLEKLTLSGKTAPVTKKVLALKKAGNTWNFEENFNTARFMHHMNYKPGNGLAYFRGGIGNTGEKGHVIAWSGTQEFEAIESVMEVKVEVDCYADFSNWEGAVEVGLSLDGKTIIKKIAGDKKKRRQKLGLEVKLPKASKKFYVHLIMKNSSGVYSKSAPAAKIFNYKVNAK